MTARLLKALALAAGLAAIGGGANARDLVLGMFADITSLDPHFHITSTNTSMSRHFFDPLILQDERQRLRPGLAESWATVDETTWEFRLRRGVKFHDGSDFTAEDVAFTMRRAPNVPNSPGGVAIYTRQIRDIIVVDPYTIRFKTEKAYPLMPREISAVAIISRNVAERATTQDFNAGRAMIGTGPFRFVEWVPGERLVAERHDAYWGDKPAWTRVSFKAIANDSARVAALIAGDVDLIEFVPSASIGQLERRADLKMARSVSNRVIYIQIDSDRDRSPFVTDLGGRVLEPNPLKDARVRRAISRAINRGAIVQKVMEDTAIPASQLLPDGYFGVSPNLKPEPHDLDGARRLLAEAGYPNGFAVTFHTPNNRYPNDDKVAQAVAQHLTRAGIATKLEAMPWSVFAPRRAKLEFSICLSGWGSETGESSAPLKALVATYDRAKGLGEFNRGRYSNRQMDALLERALATFDDEQRDRLLQQANEIVAGEAGLIPIYYPISTWAMRRHVDYVARSDEYTLAMGVRPSR